MKHRVIVVPAITLCLLLTASAVPAAKRLQPTSDALRHKLNFVAIAKASEKLSGSSFSFTKVRMIQGESEGPWQIRMSFETAAQVEVGKEYTIAFSGHFLSKEHAPWIDPEGLRLLTDPFVGGEVLLPVVDRLTTLLSTTDEQRTKEPQKVIENILEIIRVQNDTLCRVAVSELALRPALLKQTSSRQKAILRMIITDEKKDPQARMTLLEASYLLEGADAAWAVSGARLLVQKASLQVDPDSVVPSLQRAALLMLRKRGRREDMPDIARLLASSHAGVGTAAMKALAEFDELEAARTIRKLLADKKVELPVQSRHDFEQFVKQMILRNPPRPQQESEKAAPEPAEEPDADS